MSVLETNFNSKKKITMLDEYFIWIATLVKMYDIKGLDFNKNLLVDTFDSIVISRLQYFAYKLKHTLKK